MTRTGFLLTAAMITALMGHAGEMPDFSHYDLDNDGLITEDEYVSYQTGTRQASESEAVAKFTKIDLNQNRRVTEEELAIALDGWRVGPKTTSMAAADLAKHTSQ